MGKVASDFSFRDKIGNVLRQSSIRLGTYSLNNNLKTHFQNFLHASRESTLQSLYLKRIFFIWQLDGASKITDIHLTLVPV